MESGGDHICGKRLAEPLAQLIRIQRLWSGVESDEVFVHYNRAVTHTHDTQERILDFADLDAKAADLHLRIAAAVELELPVRQPTSIVTAPVPAARQKRALRALRVVDVAAAYAHTRKDDLTDLARRHR